MSDENGQVAGRAWTAYASGDVDSFAACLTEDWVEHDPDGETQRLADNVEIMRIHRDAFPDKRAEILHQLVQGDLVAQHVEVTATHTGSYFDLAPTDKAVRLVEMMIHRMRDGRIAETWAITHGHGFYQQLTGRPAPETTENIG